MKLDIEKNEQGEALCALIREQIRQEVKWGEQNHSPEYWLLILMEEIGEFCRARMEKNHEHSMKELVQVAAVAQTMLECAIRNKWEKK